MDNKKLSCNHYSNSTTSTSVISLFEAPGKPAAQLYRSCFAVQSCWTAVLLTLTGKIVALMSNNSILQRRIIIDFVFYIKVTKYTLNIPPCFKCDAFFTSAIVKYTLPLG